jgi:hypothetical protein
MNTITKAEREDLQRLIRQREKVLKSAAKQRSAELLADFENQMGAVYQPEDDPIWQEATRIAREAALKANAAVAKRCAEIGIAKGFAPGVNLDWNHRGYDNRLAARRQELRIMAQTRIAAIERAAVVKIETDSLDAQTEIAVSGLASDAAKAVVARLRPIEELMPKLSFEEFAGEAKPPVAEQLISPSVLRQRRYRERLAKRNGDAAVTSLAKPSEDEEGTP